jgi:hypothetical protein
LFEETEVEGVALLRNVLLRSRPNEKFRIVMIIRDLIDLVPSSYAQKVKFSTITNDFDSFFQERMQARRVNYFETAKRWADVFSWESICIRRLDRNNLINGDLLDDFMSLCGLELTEESTSLMRRPGISNTSPGWRILEAARALFGGCHGLPANHPLALAAAPKEKKKLLPKKERMALGQLCLQVGDKWGWNEDKGYYLTRAQAQRCFDIYRDNIEAFNKHLPVTLPMPADPDAKNFKAREFLPEARCIPAEELRAFYEEVESLRQRKAKPRRTPRRARSESRRQRGRGRHPQPGPTP